MRFLHDPILFELLWIGFVLRRQGMPLVNFQVALCVAFHYPYLSFINGWNFTHIEQWHRLCEVIQFCVFVCKNKPTLINFLHFCFKKNVWRILPQSTTDIFSNLANYFFSLLYCEWMNRSYFNWSFKIKHKKTAVFTSLKFKKKSIARVAFKVCVALIHN